MIWLGHFKGSRTWSKRETIEISAFLKICNHTRPSDIHRSIRSLDHIKYWKATEFRTFLLYIGIVALKNRLSQDEYDMFIKLHCAVTICSSNAYLQYLPLARQLFTDFIENHINVYGESSITMNIHNLSHVADDVEIFGSLSTISAYEFENCLHHLKLRLKQCSRPLEQIARRLSELAAASKVTTFERTDAFPQLNHPFTLSENILGFRRIKYKPDAMLCSANKNIKDKWFLTRDNKIVEFDFVTEMQGKFVIRGSALKNMENFFQKPFDSKHLNIFLCDAEKSDFEYVELNAIKAKMYCLPFENKFVFIPLLHTL